MMAKVYLLAKVHFPLKRVELFHDDDHAILRDVANGVLQAHKVHNSSIFSLCFLSAIREGNVGFLYGCCCSSEGNTLANLSQGGMQLRFYGVQPVKLTRDTVIHLDLHIRSRHHTAPFSFHSTVERDGNGYS